MTKIQLSLKIKNETSLISVGLGNFGKMGRKLAKQPLRNLNFRNRNFLSSRCLILFLVSTVGEPPELVKPLEDKTVVLPEEASLQCTISPGDPPASVSWFKDDKEIKGKDDRVVPTYKDSKATLTFKKVELKDTARYRVEASNKMGRVETECKLTVHSKWNHPLYLNGSYSRSLQWRIRKIHRRGADTVWMVEGAQCSHFLGVLQ